MRTNRNRGLAGRRMADINEVLRRAMAVMGVCLALALVWKRAAEWEFLFAQRIAADAGQPSHVSVWKQKLGGGLADLFWYLFPVGTYEAEFSEESSPGTKAGAAESAAGWMKGWLPLLGYEERKNRSGQPAYSDPSYEEYLRRQEAAETYRYMLLYGDETSGAGADGYDTDFFYGDSEMESGQSAGTAPADGQAGSLSCVSRTPAHDSTEALPVLGTLYMVEQLKDYDFLMKHFYSVHPSTTAAREEMDAEKLLEMDLSIEKDGSGPQILVYHTHSQETFADYPGNPEADIVGVGTYLTELLEAKGYQVIHDTSEYDMMDGKLDRNHAYNYALDGISGILQKYPSIEVVLDIHRDGVNEDLHMVSQINGKATAPIMFFNGMSQTPEGPIEYLQNPYKQENLAFSLQMQVNAEAYFPGFTRKIYLKGLRYNLHVRPRSALVEVGAQTNTYEEARNAMEPLAELVDLVLSGGDRSDRDEQEDSPSE